MRTLLYWHIFDKHTFFRWNINMMMVTQKFICISFSPSLSRSLLVNIENGIFGLLFNRSSISTYILGCYLPFAFHWKVEKNEIRTDRIFIFICIFIKNNDFKEMAKKLESSHRRYVWNKYGVFFRLCDHIRSSKVNVTITTAAAKAITLYWSTDRPTDSGLNRV